jgi:hypothetical protein
MLAIVEMTFNKKPQFHERERRTCSQMERTQIFNKSQNQNLLENWENLFAQNNKEVLAQQDKKPALTEVVNKNSPTPCQSRCHGIYHLGTYGIMPA